MNATFMPVVVSVRDPDYTDRHVLDVLFDDLAVGYSMGRPHGQRLLTWHEFDRMQLNRRELRRRAAGGPRFLSPASAGAQLAPIGRACPGPQQLVGDGACRSVHGA